MKLGKEGRMSDIGSRSWWSTLDRRRANVVVAAAALMLVVVLVLFGLQLRSTQADSRDRVISRFQDRAQVISALTQAILSTVAAPAATARQYDAVDITAAQMDKAALSSHLAYATLFDEHGDVVASSHGFSTTQRAQVLASSALQSVVGGAPVALSDVHPGGTDGAGVIDLAVGLNTASGRRILVSGAPTTIFGTFLATYLQRVPTRGGTAYILDSRGNVVGARDVRQALGKRATEEGLTSAVQRRGTGAYGPGGYFVSVPVVGTTWHVVLTSTKASLFETVSGTRKWFPWMIYAALGIVALGFLALLRRMLGIASALSEANDDLETTNAQLEGRNALLRHAAELARSNAELEQFASIASHDLQEPLRKVQTFAAQLTASESENLSEQGQDFLRRMSNAAGRMRALIDDLLMFSRVSTKGRPFVPIPLSESVAQVLMDLDMGIEESGARVTVGELPTVEADPVQMRQLLQNLLGNALKFRREGVPPEIDVEAQVSGGVAELTIRDNGLGFDPQYATRIFRAFERLHGTSAYPGTGIGLALCRKIVERHHGTITADSTPGHGALFTIRLPVEQPADSAPPASLFPEAIHEEDHHALA
jgi:signal transduction histidine kinase